MHHAVRIEIVIRDLERGDESLVRTVFFRERGEDRDGNLKNRRDLNWEQTNEMRPVG